MYPIGLEIYIGFFLKKLYSCRNLWYSYVLSNLEKLTLLVIMWQNVVLFNSLYMLRQRVPIPWTEYIFQYWTTLIFINKIIIYKSNILDFKIIKIQLNSMWTHLCCLTKYRKLYFSYSSAHVHRHFKKEIVRIKKSVHCGRVFFRGRLKHAKITRLGKILQLLNHLGLTQIWSKTKKNFCHNTQKFISNHIQVSFYLCTQLSSINFLMLGFYLLLFICLISKSVHCLTNVLFIGNWWVDDVLVWILVPLVWITVSSCFCTSVQEIEALERTLLESSIMMLLGVKVSWNEEMGEYFSYCRSQKVRPGRDAIEPFYVFLKVFEVFFFQLSMICVFIQITEKNLLLGIICII